MNRNAFIGRNVEILFKNSVGDNPSVIKKLQEIFTIEGRSLMKRGINGIQHSVSKKHLNRYCDEYAYRYNSRKVADTERFVDVMVHTEGRLTYKQLIQK